MKKIACLILFSLLIFVDSYALVPAKGMTSVTDTFQIGRYVVKVSLPKSSVIVIGKNPDRNGLRCGMIFLDSLKVKDPVFINDASLASNTVVGVKIPGLMESIRLPNNFTVRLYKGQRNYTIQAFSDRYRMELCWDAPTVEAARSLIPVFKSICILDRTSYDNTKSARKKKWAQIR